MDAARLSGQWGTPGDALEPGEHPIGVSTGRDGLVYVPDTATAPAPLMVFLHGAGGTGRREMRAWLAAADRFGAVVIAPDSRGPTWDVIHEREFGPDIRFLDAAIGAVVPRFAVAVDNIALAGVSDGASYALSVGMANGDAFPSIVAYSPGFIVAMSPVGQPRVFISHGTSDPILPFEVCGKPIAAGLASAGYDVTFREFDGGHTVPPPVADAGFAWWLAGQTSNRSV
jgi:phospholipase/carboxylesterase